MKRIPLQVASFQKTAPDLLRFPPVGAREISKYQFIGFKKGLLTLESINAASFIKTTSYDGQTIESAMNIVSRFDRVFKRDEVDASSNTVTCYDLMKGAKIELTWNAPERIDMVSGKYPSSVDQRYEVHSDGAQYNTSHLERHIFKKDMRTEEKFIGAGIKFYEWDGHRYIFTDTGLIPTDVSGEAASGLWQAQAILKYKIVLN